MERQPKFRGEGSYTFSDGSKTVHFKWDMHTLTELAEMHNVTIKGIMRCFMDPSPKFLSDFLYVGASRYAKVNKKDQVNREFGIDLMDDMGVIEAMSFLENAFQSALPEDEKKQKPQKVGQN